MRGGEGAIRLRNVADAAAADGGLERRAVLEIVVVDGRAVEEKT